MQNTMISKKQKFVTKSGFGTMTVYMTRSVKSGRFAVCINWPAGMDDCPSVKWFDDEASALADFPNVCKWVETEYKMIAC